MCNSGFCANKICGLLFAALNSAVCLAYVSALIMLFIECGTPCYPHYFTPYLYGFIMVASALMLYVIGYLLSWFAYKRGQGQMSGCNIWIIILVELLLLLVLAFVLWNMVHLMGNVHAHDYPQLYCVMVLINVVWNVLLIVISMNILKKTEEDKQKQSFTELSPIDIDQDDNDDNDDSNSNDCEEMIAKAPDTSMIDQPSNDDVSEDDHLWRQEVDSQPMNAYRDTAWHSYDNNAGVQTTDKDKNDNVSAYGSCYNYPGDASLSSAKDTVTKNQSNPFGNSSSDTVAKVVSNNDNAWA